MQGNPSLFAQSLAVNTSGVTADASAMVDITSTTKGLLIPRVALTALNDASPLTTPANSLLIYNTATAGAAATLVSPGYYFWDATGLKWIAVSGNGSNNWGLLGNYNTTAANNFMGSSDNVDVIFKTNNTETFRMTNTQRLLIGATTPGAPGTQKLEVSSGATLDAIYGHSNNVGGWLGYESNITIGTPPQNILGAGVFSTNSTAGYTSLFSSTTGAATIAASINYSNVWMANYNLVNNSSNTTNPSSVYAQLVNTSTTLGNLQAAILVQSDRGTISGNPGYTVGVRAVSNSQNQDAYAVFGNSFTNSTLANAGGYFAASNYVGTTLAYAYVGAYINGTARKIEGTGTVSEIVPTANHGRVTLTRPESPEYWYQDYGTVKLVNGRAHVDLDPILVDIIMVNDENPIRVFCTPVDMLQYNGVAVINRTPTGFDLVEMNNGSHSGTLDYQLVVKPKTNYGEGRFPQAPGPAWLKADKEPAAAKAKNNPKDGRKIFNWPSDSETYNYKPEDLVGVGEEVLGGPHHGMIKMADGTFKPANPVDKRSISNEKE